MPWAGMFVLGLAHVARCVNTVFSLETWSDYGTSLSLLTALIRTEVASLLYLQQKQGILMYRERIIALLPDGVPLPVHGVHLPFDFI